MENPANRPFFAGTSARKHNIFSMVALPDFLLESERRPVKFLDFFLYSRESHQIVNIESCL